MFCLETAPIVLNLSQLKLITDINSEINNSLSTTRMCQFWTCVRERERFVHQIILFVASIVGLHYTCGDYIICIYPLWILCRMQQG